MAPDGSRIACAREKEDQQEKKKKLKKQGCFIGQIVYLLYMTKTLQMKLLHYSSRA